MRFSLLIFFTFCTLLNLCHCEVENSSEIDGTSYRNQLDAFSTEKRSVDYSTAAPSVKNLRKCSRQSLIIARQALVHELDTINNYNSIWFNDLDKEELLEEQKQSLAGIIMSGSSQKLLNSYGQPLIELESSYFRPIGSENQSVSSGARNLSPIFQPTIGIRLLRKHQDRCQLNQEKGQFTYIFGLTIGPFEHNLDVLYHLPKELSLSQPIDWRFAQVKLIVPKMSYEITLKQNSNYHLGTQSGCPIDVADVTFLSSSAVQSQIVVVTSGLAASNQTNLQLDRLFNDYTRPTVSIRLRQMLKFYLSTKTLPLAAI